MGIFNENEVFERLQRKENICRFCFCTVEALESHSVFQNNSFQTLLYYLQNEIKLIDDDFLPKLMCSNCYTSLENTYNFLQLVVESQNIVSKFIVRKTTSEHEKNVWSGYNSDNDEISHAELFNNTEDKYTKEIICSRVNKTEVKYCKKKTKNGTSKQKAKSRKIMKFSSEKTVIKKKCCNQEFNTKTEFNAHVRSHGIVKKRYECSHCDKKYVSNFELEIHLRKHSGVRPFSCTICQKSFTDQRNMKKHEKIHSGNRTHECPVCHKKFLHSFTLKIHERIHSGDKPFICENCGKSFNTSTELKIHYRTHTKEKPYICSICEKAFCSKAALNTHMIVHTGEKKYGCTICSRKCRTSYDLKTHMRCHSNERPYACKYSNCDKRYKNSSQLNVHLRTHKGEKSHQCTICFKKFGESNTLKRHMGIHEKNPEKIT